MRSATLIPRFVAFVGLAVAVAWTAFALSPNLVVAVILNALVTGIVVLVVPPIFAALSLAIPPKIRSFGFAVSALWILPGLILLPVVGALADEWGIRTGLILMVPVFLVGAMVVASAGKEIEKDIKRVWTAAAAQSEVLYERRQGRAKLLLVRGVSVHYDSVQVLFDVDLEVDEGEIVALLGTNGAGKSTLLKAIAGIVDPSEGAIVFDGRDMTYTPAGRDRGARRDDGAGRPGRVPVADRPGEPPARGLAAPQGQGPHSARRPSRCSRSSRSSGSGSTSRPATCPAASSRC